MASAEERELLKITNNQYQNFYNMIFGIRNHNVSRLDKLERILNENRNFMRYIIKTTSYNFASAAADFARKMISQVPASNNDVKCKNFCDYFEFVIIEFKDIYHKRKRYDTSQNSRIYLEDTHFNGPLLKKTTKEITDNAFNDIKKLYDDYSKVVDTAVRKLTNKAVRSRKRLFYDQIKKMAEYNKIVFSSTLLGVYHWRKHRHMHGNHGLGAYDYFKEANKLIRKGYLIENEPFEFRKEKNLKEFLVAVVNRDNPTELVTYHRKKRDKKSRSYCCGIKTYTI
jgi:hypothetical protein